VNTPLCIRDQLTVDVVSWMLIPILALSCMYIPGPPRDCVESRRKYEEGKIMVPATV